MSDKKPNYFSAPIILKRWELLLIVLITAIITGILAFHSTDTWQELPLERGHQQIMEGRVSTYQNDGLQPFFSWDDDNKDVKHFPNGQAVVIKNGDKVRVAITADHDLEIKDTAIWYRDARNQLHIVTLTDGDILDFPSTNPKA